MDTKTHKVRHGIFTAIGVLMCVVLIPVVIINCTLIAKQFVNQDEVPSFGGVFPMIVLTDSMKGTFDAGSLLICNTIDAKDVKQGDIICYFDPAGSGSTTTTHRVEEVKTDETGNISFITKGDANNAADTKPVPATNLVGIYRFHIDGLGSFAMFMQTTPGLIIFAVLPVALLVIYDVVRRRIYEKQKDSQTDELIAELETLRAQKDAQEMQAGAPLQPTQSAHVEQTAYAEQPVQPSQPTQPAQAEQDIYYTHPSISNATESSADITQNTTTDKEA